MLQRLTFISCLAAVFISGFSQQISPMLVGVNVWYIDPSQEVWDLTEASGVTSLRIGGHSYDDNMPSKAQLKDWVTRIQAMGAEPIIQVSEYDPAADAADLVNFFNVELATGKAVKYWNIGNEPWLQNGKPAISTVGAMVEAYFKPRAVAMKEVDPTIKIYGPDFCYYIGEAIDDLFGGANDIAGKIPGKDYYYCDGISWHRYPQADNINLAYAGIEDFKGSIIACKAKVDAVNTAKNRTGDEALGWGIGEYNAKGGSVVHTWMNGQMFGGILDLCMKYGATYATSWSMFENGGNRQGTDFSFIDGANMTPRASYRHMEMIAKHFTGSYLEGTSTLSDIIVFGSKDADSISVMIMNRAESAVSYTLHLNSSGTSDNEVIINVDAASDIEYSDIIAGEASQLLLFKNDEIYKINYSSEHFDNELAPDETKVAIAKFAPEAPFNLASSEVTYKSIDLSWEIGENDTISGFFIERKKDSDENFEVVGMADYSALGYQDGNLEDETAYNYRIQSYNTAGKSDYSNESSATTLSLPEKIAYNGPHSIPGIIQVEDYNNNEEGIGYHDAEPSNQGGAYRLNEGVDVQACTDEGGGYNVGYVESGEWLEYRVENIQDGTYDIAVRTASNANNTNRIRIYLDDDYLGFVSPKFTGGWQIWETLFIEDVEISGGNDQILKLLFEGQEFNVNWIEIGEDLRTGIHSRIQNAISAYYLSKDKLLVLKSDKMLPEVTFTLFDVQGKAQFKITEENFLSSQYAIQVPAGVYLLQGMSNSTVASQAIFVR